MFRARGLNREMRLFSSTLQVFAQQLTNRHDSEHRGLAVGASGAVSWNRATMFVFAFGSDVDFCRLVNNNQLTGTIPSAVGQLPLLSIWYDFLPSSRDRLSPRLQ